MTENAKHTQGPYIVDVSETGAKVFGANSEVVCDCGYPADGIAGADAERIRLALTCHDPLLAACECHELWAKAESEGLGSFHDRMELSNQSEFLTRKALAQVRGEPFDEEYKGMPKLVIRLAKGES